MVFEIIVKPEAEKDLNDALIWYENQQNNLSTELYLEFVKTIDYIQENPNYFQKRYKEIRITFTKRFPFGIHYTIEKKTIFIHAILHTSRKLPY